MPLAQLTVLVLALIGWPDSIAIQPSRGDHAAFALSAASPVSTGRRTNDGNSQAI